MDEKLLTNKAGTILIVVVVLFYVVSYPIQESWLHNMYQGDHKHVIDSYLDIESGMSLTVSGANSSMVSSASTPRFY
ncbi:MAG: hypothetical protein AUJ28_01770 [Parcubacteria group bacterium CG1_02_37_51]|uniref:Uncharacterized protein n=1 Tax=Candidatus Komeilibacteria bacterium CG_4_10_14_0_8_um_filter_37_78 TaxID=1974471 RepID=A0A2M7RAY5_9BACT|nr:MAG: hypothetical protein AUJ28_01770 [Parcubacteria group bacterium CG1_02_37_51]PIY93933.1 MAG: hypothetical protein COY67_03350 [Candidatus Komeilibacteria bacterium CG_4_10_14_0_8_um_filter_37_78]